MTLTDVRKLASDFAASDTSSYGCAACLLAGGTTNDHLRQKERGYSTNEWEH